MVKWNKDSARDKLSSIGMKMIGEFKTADKNVRVLITKGKFSGYIAEFSVRAAKERSAKHTVSDFTIGILLNSEKKRFMDDRATERGYKILEYPENYSSTKPMKMLSPQNNEWTTQWNYFYSNNTDCPMDVRASYGERVIKSLLTENGIPYKYQYTIHYEGKIMYADFYLEEPGIVIEYNGIQHYEDKKFGHTDVKEVQDRDMRKKKWCKENNVELLVIPYTEDTIDKIANCLYSKLPIENTNVEIMYDDGLEEGKIIDYFKIHEAIDTEKHFGITNHVLYSICARNGFNKHEYHRAHLNSNGKYSEIICYYKDHTQKETKSHFSISQRELTKAMGDTGFNKAEYVESIKYVDPKEVLEFYKVNEREEVLKKFNLSHERLIKIIKEYGFKKRDYQYKKDQVQPGDEELISYYKDHEMNDVAEKFNCSKNHITTVAKRNGFNKVHYTKEQLALKDQEIVDFYKNHDQNEVVEKYEISKQFLFNICKRNGFSKANYKREQYKIFSKEVLAYYEEHTGDETANHFDIKPSYVFKIARDAGFRKVKK